MSQEFQEPLSFHTSSAPTVLQGGSDLFGDRDRCARPTRAGERILVAYGHSNVQLAKDIISCLERVYGHAVEAPVESTRFADGEISVRFLENIRGSDLFIICSVCPPNVNDNLMELLLLVDAARRASAYSVTAVVPYYGYARQDRKSSPRMPISAKLVADLLVAAGINRIIVQDIHAAQIQGFFPASIPFDHIQGEFVMVRYLADLFRDVSRDSLVVVSPDAGGAARNRQLASRLHADLAIVDKRRVVANHSDVMNVIGRVEEKTCLIYDDMVDTAGTLVKAAAALKERGAKLIYACASHAVLSGSSTDPDASAKRIANSHIDCVIFSDTIPISPSKRAILGKKLRIVSCAEIFAVAIDCIHINDSFGERIQAISHDLQAHSDGEQSLLDYYIQSGTLVMRSTSHGRDLSSFGKGSVSDGTPTPPVAFKTPNF